MNLQNWLLFLGIVQIVHGLGTWKMYVAAGRGAWEAFIPIYNAVIATKIMNRPWYYVIVLLLPVVNILMLFVFWVEMCRSFGYNKPKDSVLVILTLGFYLYYLNYTQPLNYIEDRSLKPRIPAGEWTSSILFAIIAATIVHTYVMQPFIIPTSSLEKSLLVGDFLLVSKFHYGARIPMTTIAAPMVHDTIPVLNVKSYLSKPELPYMRLPGFQDVKRNDIVVFNWPVDSLNFYGADDGKYYYKPIDKRTNYVKRCVGIPGDMLSMEKGKVFINGEPLDLPERAKIQRSYQILTDGYGFTNEQFIKNYNITDGVSFQKTQDGKGVITIKSATEEAIKKLKSTGHVLNVVVSDALPNAQRYPLTRRIDGEVVTRSMPYIFPYTGLYQNTGSERESFLIPENGQTVDIDYKNIHYYKRIIEVYEGSEMDVFNQVSIQGNDVFLNSEPLKKYTFKQNYYWLMGDNRDNSLDSRYWGYVPESHVVGKPVFVWMSIDTNTWTPRWERIFTTVNGSGQPRSYFLYFIVGLGIFIAGNRYYKKKKKTS